MPVNPFHKASTQLVVFLAIFTLFLPLAVSAQTVSGAGSTSTNFLKIGEGARAEGMGEAFTGVSDDVTAIFWNPAGLVLARGTQFNLTHGEWLQGVTTEFFAFSQNLERDGAFGGSIAYLGTGTFPGALENPGNGSYGGPGPDISASSYAGSVAYSQRLGNWIGGDFFKSSMLGIRVNVVGQNVVNFASSGVAFDLGYMYELERKKIYLGATLSNLGTQIEDYTQPLNYTFGGSYQLHNALMKKDRNIFAVDAVGYNDTGFGFNFGDEYQISFGRNDVALRAGYRTTPDQGGEDGGLTAGIGICHHFDDFAAGLDYAFVPYGVLGNTSRISLNIVMGGELVKPLVYSSGPATFVLGQNSIPVNFSTKNEEPINTWKLTLLDSSGMMVATKSGKGNPPSRWLWDGKNQAGALVPQGNYTVNLEVTDDNDLTGRSIPHTVYAKWVPKRVPYLYTFQVPGDLLFDSAKAELQPRGYDAIQKAVAAIKQRYPTSTIIVAGYTDDQKLGKGAKYKDNQELSLARAQAVKNYLVLNGMDPQKLSVVGYGDTKPIADNKTPEGRAKNRRVELIVSGVMDAGPDQLINEGLAMMNAKRYRDALERFLKAIEADTRNSKAYHLAGDCYLILGGKAQAAQAYRRALELNPNDTSLKTWLDKYAPSAMPAPAPVAPSTKPVSSIPPAKPASAAQAPAPVVAAPAAAAPVPVSSTAPPTGMPQPVDTNN